MQNHLTKTLELGRASGNGVRSFLYGVNGRLRLPSALQPAWLGPAIFGVALLTALAPLIAAGLLLLLYVALAPRFSRALLMTVFVLTPSFNPAVLSFGNGRIYLFHLAVVIATVGATALTLRVGEMRKAVHFIFLAGAYIAITTVGRDASTLAWVYRPLQPFFVVFAVVMLMRRRGRRLLPLGLAWGAIAGCGLAAINALFPYIDPFRLSRPADIPFISTIGTYARASGAFVYPNNLGTFAAYAIVLGLASLLFGRPWLPRPVAAALVATAGAALVASGARAAALGLIAASVYMTVKARPGRKILLLGGQIVAGLVLVILVTASGTGRQVAEERVGSALGPSLSGRVEQWDVAVDDFRRHPLFGVGVTDSRLDSMWLLQLSGGGIVGCVVLLLLFRTTFGRPRDASSPELWVALLITLLMSGVLQDSLGQTLASWFFGAAMGLSLLPKPEGHDRSPPREERDRQEAPFGSAREAVLEPAGTTLNRP